MSWDLERRTAENYGRPDKKRAREGTGPPIVVYLNCPGGMDMVNGSGKLVKEPEGSLGPRELAGTSSGNCPNFLGPEGEEYYRMLESEYRMLESELTTHSRHRCKYLNEKPPEKGGSNKCAICYRNHWTIYCPFWQYVPPGAKVGPCFVILCQLCGHLIDNKLSCPSCGGKVEGELCYRICDCCGENMLERCRCHFLSESSISLD